MLIFHGRVTDRTTQALDRLERALLRVENAAETLAAAPPASNNPDTGLVERHARLKAETRDAISAIDRILRGDA